MKTNATYKMSSTHKKLLSTIDDPHQRSVMKAAFIEATSHENSRFVMNYDVKQGGNSNRKRTS